MELKEYEDLLANVRYDGKLHSIRDLVRPDDPDVKEVADVLIQWPDFITASQDFVAAFTVYREEVGDYWARPAETLASRAGDCDDLAILLCSILRNYIPAAADGVFCAIGTKTERGKDEGHMWVVTKNKDGKDRIIEATAPSTKKVTGIYKISALFNDEYTFATAFGLKTFGLLPLESLMEGLVVASCEGD